MATAAEIADAADALQAGVSHLGRRLQRSDAERLATVLLTTGDPESAASIIETDDAWAELDIGHADAAFIASRVLVAASGRDG